MIASLLSRLSDNYPMREEDCYPYTTHPYDSLLTELKMLLLSRTRLLEIESIPLVNESILNYGINESLCEKNEITSKRMIIEQRLQNTITRFEPRLENVSIISNIDNPQAILFTIHGHYCNIPVALELKWNDCTGRFYFNE